MLVGLQFLVKEPEFADYRGLQLDCRSDKADDEEFDTYLSKAMKRVCAGEKMPNPGETPTKRGLVAQPGNKV